MKLDCVSNCRSNVTVGFAHHTWDGNGLPIVMGNPLESSDNIVNFINGESTPGLKILGWMGLTLVLVMLAIQLGQKIANKFDAKIQE